MRGRQLRWLRIPVAASLCLASCTNAIVTESPLSEDRIGRLQNELVRGIATKVDVLTLLGEPQSSGELGGFDALRAERQGASDLDRTGPFDAWYYHESTTRIDKSTDGMEMWNQTEIDKSTAVMEMWHHAEVVVVFFQGDRYDGFLRFGTATTGIAELE